MAAMTQEERRAPSQAEIRAACPDTGKTTARRAFAIINPLSGSSDLETLRAALTESFHGEDECCEIYEITGQEELNDVMRQAIERKYNMFIAAGGDGTISGVADALVHSGLPLGVIPAGTGNGLALALGIPREIQGALDLILGEHDIMDIDTLRVGDRHYVLNVSMGISSLTMRDTESKGKKRFGNLAYLWVGFQKVMRIEMYRFRLSVDGQEHRFRASDVIINNSGVLGDPKWKWQEGIHLDDGKTEVCIVRARNWVDYLKLVWSFVSRQQRKPQVVCLPARQEVQISATHPLPVQADGEIIGRSPVEVKIVPAAVRVIVPKKAAPESAKQESSS